MRSFSFCPSEILAGLTNKLVFALFLLLLLPISAQAASLSFLPATGTYNPGTVFSTGITVSSQGEALNAVSGVVSYPKDLLEIVSISKSQSVISLWVQEPYFSNSEGTVHFEGIVLNPGFTGNGGKVLTITFKVKSTGQADLVFAAGSVLANDGEGSEILTSKSGAQFSFTSPAVPPPLVPVATTEEESAVLPEVLSDTNPQNGWSAQTTGIFTFSIPDSVISMRLLLDEKPDSVPVVVYTPPVPQREISDLSEGVSYLHVQYKDAAGWGEILHHKIQVDTEIPETFAIKEVGPGTFLFTAADALSGIARYEVQINNGPAVEFIDDGSHLYRVPEQPAGLHTLFVKAFDAAGNSTSTSIQFESQVNVPAVPVPIPVPVADVESTPVNTNSSIVSNGAVLITVLSIVIPSLALILLLGVLLYLAWRGAGGLRRRVDREVKEANLIVHKAFTLLKTDLELDVESLKKANKKRKLTREESKILKRLQVNLDEAERVISKEVSDIEKEVSSEK